jgi:hypothetical protein
MIAATDGLDRCTSGAGPKRDAGHVDDDGIAKPPPADARRR